MAIYFDGTTKTFYLDGKEVTYSFYINEYNYCEHLYFGKTIAHDDIRHIRDMGVDSCVASVPGKKRRVNIDSYHHFPSELSFFGTGDYREPCVLVENASGDRISNLLFDSYEILEKKPKINGMPSLDGGETLVLHLIDKVSNFGADLYYTVYDDCNIIARRIVYKNLSKDRVTLRRAYSFTFALNGQNYDVLSLYGGWAKERNIQKTHVQNGVISIDSKRSTSSATLNPFIAVMTPNSNEKQGDVYGFSLVYSSSFKLSVEGISTGDTQICGGINDFDFSWELKSGEVFETPEVVIAYSDSGLGKMSRTFHDAFRSHLINKRFVKSRRPLLINNWEATYFSFDEKKLMAIADAVEGTGIDTFVLDDGWFGKRDDDTSGLGDWKVNNDKLKGGLKAVIDHVHSKNMKFGLWFEPETVNEDSDLYRVHPDYAIGAPNRERCYSRNQFVLDLTRDEVRDYIVDSVNSVLHENEIDYVKWDYNRNVTEFYSCGRNAKNQSEFAHRYALGLYDICERIVEKNPNIIFEGCAGGGGRFDPAMLHYFPQIWTSDDTDANERTYIQYGTSMVYPLSSMSCHVSVCPNHQTGRTTPFSTRANIAHLGATGYELDTTAFSNEEKEEVKKQVEDYRKIEDLILNGDLFRIDNPYESNHFTFEVISKDKAEGVLVSYRRMTSVNVQKKHIRFEGLLPNEKYFIEEMDKTFYGSTLENVGILVDYPQGDFASTVYHFRKI